MIVMKFGGSSLADAERILAAVEIVRGRVARRPVVVVSALAGVTDLLQRAVEVARGADFDALEPLLAELERRHRWALAGTVEQADRRHGLSLELDGLFEDLRRRLRSIRILGEGTPRARDTVLACGEALSSRIVAAALADRGLSAVHVSASAVLVTDERFSAAEPDLQRSAASAARELHPRLAAGLVPVVGGFVGATPAGDVTTLGRGGSDTSAAVLGMLLDAEEIEIWTDVDGLMSADPRHVPGARCLERVSFAEAAELAHFGARVLHPHAIAPAVRRQIPVRVLNSRRPGGPGTLVLGDDGDPPHRDRVALASRGGISLLRVRGRRLRHDPELLPAVLAACGERQVVPELLLASEIAVSLALPGAGEVGAVAEALAERADVERQDGRAMVCAVGAGLAGERPLRRRVIAELANWSPEIVAVGTSSTSVAAILEEGRLQPALIELHRRFFEEPVGP